MRVLLVDDEPLALDRLQVAMATIPDAEVVGTAADGLDAAEKIDALRPDLVVLDIQMPGLSGMEIAQKLEASQGPDIVFVTAFNRFAIDAFSVEATDYLLKPVCFDRLRLAVDRVRRRRALSDAERRAAELAVVVTALREDVNQTGQSTGSGQYDEGIWVPGRSGSVRVPVEAIDRIEAARDYVLINTATKNYILRAKMTDIERRLDPRQMMRIHRSHIVRVDAVTAIERPGKGLLRLLLKDGANLQVGAHYQEQVTQILKL